MSDDRIDVKVTPLYAGSMTWWPGGRITIECDEGKVEAHLLSVTAPAVVRSPSISAWDAEREMRTRAMDLVLIAGGEAFKRGDLAVSKALMAIAQQIQELRPKSRPS